MSRLNELIQRLCPDGVEFKKLSMLCDLSRGKVYSKTYISENPGIYPVYSSQTENDGELGRISTYDYDGEYLTWTTDGAYAGTIFHRKGKFSITNVCGLISIKSSNILIRFLYYWLSVKAKDYVYKGMGNPKLMSNQIAPIKIPIPPLDVQNEIVRILDTFTSHAAELQAELQARKEQYEYYRNKLLTFDKDDKNVKWVKLKEYAEIGTGSSNTQDELSIGLYPFFVRSQIVRRNNEYEFDETAIITSGDGVGVGKIFHYVEGKYALHQRAYRIHVLNEKIIPKFLFHYMRCEFYNYITKNAYTSSVTSIRKPMLLNFPIPILSMSEQQRIVSILDKFEALVNDLTEGLPAEIAAVQEQYEYYRNKLLTFKDVGTYHGASST